MAAREAAPSLAEAAVRTQTTVRRAGAAWNRHDTAAVRANLEIARELRVPRLMLDYGGLRFRFDFLPEGLSAVQPAVNVQVEDGGDVQMEGDLPVGRSCSADAPTQPPVQVDGGRPSDRKASAVEDAELLRLREKAATATARRQRQKAARKKRDESARLMAAQSSPDAGGGEAPAWPVHCPLWSTTLDQRKAFIRLVGELTERCANVARGRGLHTRVISLPYGGSTYAVSVLSGTEATIMQVSRCTSELVALLGTGLTEEGLTALLERWSKPVAAGGSEAQPTTSGGSTLARKQAASTVGPAASGQGNMFGSFAGAPKPPANGR